MRKYLRRLAVTTVYQTTVTLGLLLFPLALALRQTTGIRLPIHRILDPLLQAYEATVTDPL